MTAFNSQARGSKKVLGPADSAGGETYYKRVNVTPQQEASQQALQLHHSWQLPDMHIILWDILSPENTSVCHPGGNYLEAEWFHLRRYFIDVRITVRFSLETFLWSLQSQIDWESLHYSTHHKKKVWMHYLPGAEAAADIHSSEKKPFCFFWVLAVCKPGILRTAENQMLYFLKNPFWRTAPVPKFNMWRWSNLQIPLQSYTQSGMSSIGSR